MPIEIKVPSAGESVTEGRLSRWLKPDGAAVQRDEMVCELETDKATAEVPAPAAGVLRQIAKEGDTVRIGAVIGSIDPAGAPTAAPAAAKPTAQPPIAKPQAVPALEKKVPVLMPAARRAAEEEGVDPSKVTGTGRGGRILKEDVLAAKTAGNGEPGASATGVTQNSTPSSAPSTSPSACRRVPRESSICRAKRRKPFAFTASVASRRTTSAGSA
jgi:2-oxoglutarate dehydrogenase E2 component (dihydrolipoamide succinyltransferase)